MAMEAGTARDSKQNPRDFHESLKKKLFARRNMFGDSNTMRLSVQNGHVTDFDRAVMENILCQLIHDYEMAVRYRLCKFLNSLPFALNDLIMPLSDDKLPIAGPIIMQCDFRWDKELIQLVRQRAQQHQLAIVLRRLATVEFGKSEFALENADPLRMLLEDRDTNISAAALRYVRDESQRVDTFQQPILDHRDLNPRLAELIYFLVSAALRDYLITTYRSCPAKLDDYLEASAQELASDAITNNKKAAPKRAACILAQLLFKRRKITQELITSVLARAEIPLFEALMEQLSDLEAPNLQYVLYDKGSEGLAVLCRAANISKQGLVKIFLLTRQGQLGVQKANLRDLSYAIKIFDMIDPQGARSFLKDWRGNGMY